MKKFFAAMNTSLRLILSSGVLAIIASGSMTCGVASAQDAAQGNDMQFPGIVRALDGAVDRTGTRAEPPTGPDLVLPDGVDESSAQTPESSEEKLSDAEEYFARPSQLIGNSIAREQMPDQPIVNGNAGDNGFMVSAPERELRQFGYDFFSPTQGRLTPDSMAPVGPDYVIGPGDTLIISLWGTLDGQYEIPVNRDGEIVVPKIGAVSIWGQTFEQAKQTVRKRIERYYTGFDMDITLGSLRSIQVFLVGEVRHPGSYNVSSVSSILTALVEAGGPAKTGSLRQVRLMRNGRSVGTFDFYDFLLKGDKSGDLRLQSGDTIFVPVVGPLVGLAGDLRRPAIYELTGDEVLKDALEMAGGVSSTAFLGKIEIERIEAHHKRIVRDLDLSGANALEEKLFDRDLIKVSSISPMTEKYVSLTGYVARPGQYQLTPGMRLTDLLLPYGNLLPFYYPKLADILRVDPPDFRPRKITVDLERALSGDPAQNIELHEFDEVRLFSIEQMQEISEVNIFGAVLNPGTYRLFDQMKVRDLIVAAGNVRRDAYLPEAELTRFVQMDREVQTERLLLDLEKAMQDDPDNNIELRADDHLVVRVIPEFAKKMKVQIEGKVVFPGTYTIGKGETLSSVIARAGGFDDGAYLRGAVFTRQSVKESVQSRIEKLIMQEEAKIIRVSSEIAQGAMGEQDVAAARSLLESRKEMLDRLKAVPATGRIVIHLEPLEKFKNSEFDIELMDGDRISVPENPHSVSVLGEVYNPTSLSYQVGETVSYYLDKVGGPNQDANEDEMFIVRADGSVYSRQQSGWGLKWDGNNRRWVSGGFAGTELYPGDTVLVPQKFRHLDVMREVKDITTIFYQMALGAAAVASF